MRTQNLHSKHKQNLHQQICWCKSSIYDQTATLTI